MSKLFSNVWFKCITVLLIIAGVAGGLLSILNDVLYVSPEERTARAVAKIYKVEKILSEDDIILDVDSNNPNKNTAIEFIEDGVKLGTINKILKVNNQNGYDMLFQSTGFEGYKGGSITVWVQVSFAENANPVIEQVILEKFDKQTLMSKLGASYYGKFSLIDITDAYNSGKLFAPTEDDNVILNPVSGATKSANAGCNAVNCVIKYVGVNA